MSDRNTPEPVGTQLPDKLARIAERIDDSLPMFAAPVHRFARPEEREHVAHQIDPDTAQVFFIYAETLDPYGDTALGPEYSCIGREYFAVDPGVGVAVLLYDLPERAREALEPKRREAELEGWRRIWEITNS